MDKPAFEGVSCWQDSWFALALSVERALLDEFHVTVCFLDYEKACDLLPLHEIFTSTCRQVWPPASLYKLLVKAVPATQMRSQVF